MNRVLIYIDNQLVDLLPDTVVATTFKAFDIGDITSRNASFTNRFRLPKTPANKQVFAFADNVNSGTDKPYKRLTARVVQDGIEILRSATVVLRESDKYFNIELYDGTRTFFSLLGEKTLSDLWQNPLPQNTDYSLTESVIEYIWFNDGSLNESVGELDFAGRPAIKYIDILNRIITENGYTKSGDVFSDTTLNALYLVTPMFEDRYNYKFKAPREFEALRDTSAVFNASSSGTLINFTNVIHNGGLYDGTNTYKVTDPIFGGTYFLCNAFAVLVIDSIVFSGGATRLRVALSSGSGNYVINDITAAGVYFFELSDNIGTDPLGNPVTVVIGNDGQEIYVTTRTTDNLGTPTGSAVVTFGDGTSFRVECLRDNPGATTYLNAGGVMPDLSQVDFLRDFAIRTGTLFRERNGVLECKTIAEIIDDRANAVDWTNKRDLSFQEEITYEFRDYAQNNHLRYQTGDDLTDEETGQGNISIDNENIELETEMYSSPFTSSHTRKHGNQTAGFITAAEIPIVEDGEDANDPEMRLLMVRDKRTSEPTLSDENDSYKVGYFEDVDGVEGKDAGFAHVVDTVYSTLQSHLQKAKTVTRYYNLSVVDIVSLDLFKLVFDSGAYYLINTVENFVPGRATKVQLFKVS